MLIYAAPWSDAEHEAVTWKGCDVKSRVQTPDFVPAEFTLEFTIFCLTGTKFRFWNLWILSKCRLHRQQFSPACLGQVFDFS